jgi:hypothetical protein
MKDPVLRPVNTILQLALYGFLILTAACTPAVSTATPETIRVQYSFATQPWLTSLYNCAGKDIVTAERRAEEFQEPQSAELVIRVGQPAYLISRVWQIGSDDLLVIVNSQNPLTKLTASQVRDLFTGQISHWKDINGADAPVHVWVFAAGEDVQQIFEQTVVGGSPVTSMARLANSPDDMLKAVSTDVGAIGIITRRLKTETTMDVFTVGSNLPILAITQAEPQGSLSQILACLQK